MPIIKQYRTRSNGPAHTESLSELASALPDWHGQGLPPPALRPEPERRATRPRARPRDSGGNAAEQRRPSARSGPRRADRPETPEEASRRALEELQRVLRGRGHEASEVSQLVQGWSATRERYVNTATGTYRGYNYKFTDPDGETYKNLVSAACAAEPRAEGEDYVLFDEVDWEGERYRRLAALPQYRRPVGLRHGELPPPPVDEVPSASGGFAYGDDWGNGTHAPWLVASLKAAGGDIGDDRCEKPRARLAAACQKANVRPPAYQRDLAPATWIGDVEDLAKADSNRRAALLELVSVATQIDSDCREAARENVEWDEPRCCHVAAVLAVFALLEGTEREAEVQNCVARYGEDDEIELEWLGPNRPFDLDHLAWTEIPRVPAGGSARNFCRLSHH